MNQPQRAARWVGCLDLIWGDVVAMLAARQIWRGYMHLVRANLQVDTPGTFHSWVTTNYARTQAVGVRRQTDVRTDVVSLGRLLMEIEQQPRVVSRRRSVAHYTDTMVGMGNDHFDQLVGAGRDYLDTADVAS